MSYDMKRKKRKTPAECKRCPTDILDGIDTDVSSLTVTYRNLKQKKCTNST
jgi:hypothetical protein